MDFTSIFIWWLIITIFGLAGWPLAFSLLRSLPDRGYALARPVGFLLAGYVLWLAGSFRLLQNNVGGVLIALIVTAAVGVGWRRQQRRAGDALSMRAWLRREWRYVLSVELLFHLAFIGWTIYKAYDPNIETAGGEKWMEIAFINGALRSDYFPPQDPWLSGFGVSYYYFGYVLMAMATRLSGLISTVAFNLYIPTLFAMTLTAAFGIVANLVSLHRSPPSISTADRDPATGNQPGSEALPTAPSPTPATGDQPGSEALSTAPAPSPTPTTGETLPIIQSPSRPRSPAPLLLTPALIAGFIGALFAGVMGNLIGLLEVLHKRGLLPAEFWIWLDIRDLKVPPPGPGDSWIPDRFIWWWRGSRVLTDYTLTGQEQEVIDEFPFFSFLLGDVHPHVLALPFVLLVVGLALNIAANRRAFFNRPEPAGGDQPEGGLTAALLAKSRNILQDGWRHLTAATGGRLAFVLYAVCLGGLSFLNTWDFPIYLSVVGLTLIVWRLQGQATWPAALQGGIVGTGLLGLLSIGLYLPFYATFRSQAGGLLPNLWNPTRFPQFFVFFGPFLVAVTTLLLVLAARQRGWRRHIGWSLWLTLLGPVLVMVLILTMVLISPEGRGYIQGILNNPAVQPVIGEATISGLIWESISRRAANPWTFLFLGGLLGWTLALLAGYYDPTPTDGNEAASFTAWPPSNRLSESFVLILLLVGLGLPLTVEFIYLRDNFGIRMNTVFKFYFQAWVLLALASAFAVYYVSTTLRGVSTLAWQGVMTLLVAAAMIYPILATAHKANYFQDEPTLNGIAWVSEHRPADYAGIQWLRENAPPHTVVLEAPGAGYASYQYTGRVSALTGFPTLLGWGGHQSQWRGNYEEPARREPEIETLFNTLDLNQTEMLLDKYNITHVYVGPLERERYNPRGLEKFAQIMEVAFQQDDVTIYRRR